MNTQRTTSAGFVYGSALVEGTGPNTSSQLQVEFQNENPVARLDGRLVATVSDLTCILDADTGESITTEVLGYGVRGGFTS